jgi:NADPH:quinone reductase-like Zn-dependent oxidoreductase
VVLANAADEPVGLCVLQLCRALGLRCVCVVADTPAYGAAAARLRGHYHAELVVRDVSVDPAPAAAAAAAAAQGGPHGGGGLAAALRDAGLPQARLALDAQGGRAGERLLPALRAGAPLVVYGLRGGALPRLGDPPGMPGVAGCARSMHGFVLGEWVEKHGAAAYGKMLRHVAELVADGTLTLAGECSALDCAAEGAAIPSVSTTIAPLQLTTTPRSTDNNAPLN